MPLALLLACSDFEEVKSAYDDLTNPVVVQAWFLGVEVPEGVDLGDSDWSEGATIRAFVANAEDADNLENAPVEGARVVSRAASLGTVPLEEEGDGAYRGSAPSYPESEDVVVSVDDAHKLSMTAPPAARVAIPAEMEAGEALVVSLAGQEYDNVLVVVMDTVSGEVVYDNTPQDIGALYDFALYEGALSLEVPGRAFAAESVYAVGVAGLRNADPDAFVDVNALLSAMMAGQIVFYPVSTLPDVPGDPEDG